MLYQRSTKQVACDCTYVAGEVMGILQVLEQGFHYGVAATVKQLDKRLSQTVSEIEGKICTPGCVPEEVINV